MSDTTVPVQPSTGGGNNKAVAAAIAGSICTIAAWSIKVHAGLDIPGDVEAAFQSLITMLAVYFIPHSNSQGIVN